MSSAASPVRQVTDSAEPRTEAADAPLGPGPALHLPPVAGAEALPQLKVFREIHRAAAGALSSFFGPLTAEPASFTAEEPSHVRRSSVALTSVEREAELRVSLLLEPTRESAFALAALGLAEAGPEVVDDMLRELANIVGGVIRVAADEEGVPLTGGLPTNALCEDGGELLARQAWWLLGADGEIRVGLLASVARHGNVALAARDLREGMVVAREVRGDAGQIVAPQGARLTATGAGRLADAVGPDREVDVAVVT